MRKLLLILLTLLLFSCTTQKQTKLTTTDMELDSSMLIQQANNMDVSLTAKKVEDIPILEAKKIDNKKKPLVIALHGATGSKESMHYFLTKLSSLGYFVIAPDLKGHGLREGKELFCDIVTDVTTIDTLIEYASFNELIDVKNVALIGYSMGGMLSFKYVTNGKYPIKIITTINAPCDWTILESSYLLNTSYENSKSITEDHFFEKQIMNMIEENPFKYKERLIRTKIVMGQGELDEIFPYQQAQNVYDHLRRFNEKNIELYLYPNDGHATPNAFVNEIVNSIKATMPIKQ